MRLPLPQLAVLLTLAVSFVGPAASQAQGLSFPDPPEARKIASVLRAARISLKPALNGSRILYVSAEDGALTVIHDEGPLFPVDRALDVRIRAVTGNAFTGFHLHLEASASRRGSLWMRPPPGGALSGEHIARLCSAVFLIDGLNHSGPDFVGNSTSRLLHVATCNHLPEGSDQRAFQQVEDARREGYTVCPICFARRPAIARFGTEEWLGNETERQLLMRHDVSSDPARLARVRACAGRVMERWMLPLKGYSYRFGVLNDDDLNAVACPAGAIYVTRGLLDAVESDAELEAVLAHEIAHVEQRHGLREYRSRISAGALATLAGFAAGAAAAGNGGAGAAIDQAMSVGSTLAELAAELVLLGHGREYEREADSFALAIALQGPARSTRPYATALRKMKYHGLVRGRDANDPEVMASHPDIDDRISKSERARSAALDSSAVFDALDKEDRILLTLRLEFEIVSEYLEYPDPGEGYVGGQGISGTRRAARNAEELLKSPRHRSEYRLYGRLSSTEWLRDAFRPGTLRLDLGGKGHDLSASDAGVVVPSDELGLSFRSTELRDLVQPRLTMARLVEAPGVVRWVRRASDP